MFRSFSKPVIELVNIHISKFADILIPYSIRKSLLVKATTFTLRTFHHSHELISPFLGRGRIVVLYHLTKIFHNALILGEVIGTRLGNLFRNPDTIQTSIEHLTKSILRNIGNWSLYLAIIFCKKGIYLPKDHLVLIFSQRGYSTVINRKRSIRNNLLHVNLVDHAKSLAMRTGTFWGIEREDIRSRILVGNAARRTHKSAREILNLIGILIPNHDKSLTLTHGNADGITKSFLITFLHGKLINNNLNVMVLVAIHLHATLQFENLIIHTNLEIALATHLLKEFTVMSLTIANKRSENDDTLSDIVAENHLCDLILSIFHHLLARHIAICRTRTGKEQTKIVIDLSSSADGRARIAVCRLLLDTDNWRKTRNLIHVRTLHSSKEITGVCRESLYIASLSFSKDSVEGKRRLART